MKEGYIMSNTNILEKFNLKINRINKHVNEYATLNTESVMTLMDINNTQLHNLPYHVYEQTSEDEILYELYHNGILIQTGTEDNIKHEILKICQS